MEQRRIAKNSALNLTGAVATGVFGLLQTALLAKWLALDDFGRVLIVES